MKQIKKYNKRDLRILKQHHKIMIMKIIMVAFKHVLLQFLLGNFGKAQKKIKIPMTYMIIFLQIFMILFSGNMLIQN